MKIKENTILLKAQQRLNKDFSIFKADIMKKIEGIQELVQIANYVLLVSTVKIIEKWHQLNYRLDTLMHRH
jgi:hypothetical protein